MKYFRAIIYFLIGTGTVWASHASQLESGFTTIQLVNIIIASAMGGLIAVRALLDNTQSKQ